MMHFLLYFKMEKKIFQSFTTSRIRQFKECFNFRNFTRRLEIYQVEYGLIRDVGIHIEKTMKIFSCLPGGELLSSPANRETNILLYFEKKKNE